MKIARLGLFFGCIAVSIAALAGQSTTAGYNVTATIFNYDASSNAFTVQSDGSTSAVYSPSSTVLSYMYPAPVTCTHNCSVTAFEWAADYTQSSRSYLLTLTPLAGSPAGPFSGTKAFNGEFRSRCFDPGNNVYSWLSIQTSDTNCAMRANFTYQGVKYTLVMSPIEPGTGTATVTCTHWTGSACSAWTDVPTAGGANANVAHLYSTSNSGKSTLVGSYSLTFNMTLAHS